MNTVRTRMESAIRLQYMLFGHLLDKVTDYTHDSVLQRTGQILQILGGIANVKFGWLSEGELFDGEDLLAMRSALVEDMPMRMSSLHVLEWAFAAHITALYLFSAEGEVNMPTLECLVAIRNAIRDTFNGDTTGAAYRYAMVELADYVTDSQITTVERVVDVAQQRFGLA